MVDSSTKKIITEGDIATLLQRYDTNTILKLLQEMSYYSEIKMDWNELVKKSTTGITNAREYQLLWRHLSYRDPLLPVEDDAQPLDDDSDMECELEASPALSHEASVEAIAHVKVMTASYVPRESDILDDSTVDAPLTINIPYGLPEGTQDPSESPWFSRGMNITFPVCLQKAASTEGMNANGSASSNMRKRKKWSVEEVDKLIAAVRQCGEGNWADIVKGEFRGERTASQLSKRWAHIKKKCDTSTSISQSGLQRNEEQIAANHALSLALGNRPPSKKLAVGTDTSTAATSCSITETQANGSNSSQGQQQFKPIVQALPRVGISVSALKSRVVVKKTTPNSSSRSDLMVTANSVAAAACMGGLSTAASVPKVEPGKTYAPLVQKTEPFKTASTTYMPRPSGSLSVPKVEPGKSLAASGVIKAVGPTNTQPLANGNPKLVTASASSNKPSRMALRPERSAMLSAAAAAPLVSASRTFSNQRAFAASVSATLLHPKPAAEAVTCKPDCGQKEQAHGAGASSLAAIQPNQMTSTNSEISRGKQAIHAQSPSLLPRKIPVVQTAGHGTANQKLVDNPSDKSAVPSTSGAGLQSRAKCEVNNKVGPTIKMSSVCGKPPEVATVAGTGQGV